MQKILFIRFSSIGDIVLTSPVVRCVKNQTAAKIHFLTKEKYVAILDANPHIDRVITLKTNLQEVLTELRFQKYNCIIDLHNNFRSLWIKINLGLSSYTVQKESLKKHLLIYMGINILKNHVVDRYFNTIKKLSIFNDHKGLDYFIPEKTKVDFDTNQRFIAWCIGGSYNQKTLSAEQVVNVCNFLSLPVVLLGGIQEKEKAAHIVSNSSNASIYDFCGNLSLHESAYLIKNSMLVLTNDTGLMHIAAALQKPIISFWGCTKPVLGFTPYITKTQCVNLVFNPQKRPCSKHGNMCRIQKEGCVKKIDYRTILKTISDFNQNYTIH